MPEITAGKYLVQAGWDDAPHLDEKTKKELWDATPPHLREARAKGIPALGSGAIYPVPKDEAAVAPFSIPAYWPRGYALDVGWRRTAALWMAWDRDNDCLYAYSEYYAGQKEATLHAAAIKARGAWINGCIDPAARSRSQRDGERLIDDYTGAGLRLIPADNAVEAGLSQVWERLSTGRLKIFTTLSNFWWEYGLYRRDEDGKVVKENDHLMDALRYIILNYHRFFTTQPVQRAPGVTIHAADSTAGY